MDVSIDELFAEIGEWGAGFLTTVGDDERARLVMLIPRVHRAPEGRYLRFERAGRHTVDNAATREFVSIAFPPHPGSNGMSLIVDGIATVDMSSETLDLRPLTAVRHRRAR